MTNIVMLIPLSIAMVAGGKLLIAYVIDPIAVWANAYYGHRRNLCKRSDRSRMFVTQRINGEL